ncbi:MAG: RidA family protein [Erythrobacter sp.]|jgi:reactive intermediate/imine deaminase|nr:RidA family protein [Erythrobacter sp.]
MKSARVIAAALALAAAPALAQEPARESGPEPDFVTSGGAYPFSDSVSAGEMVYLSGVIGTGPDGALVSGGIEPETRAIFDQIEARLAHHDLTLRDVVKCTVMLADMAQWPAFNAVYAGYFEPGRYPARSAFGATALALGARVELECMAYRPRK